MSFHAILRHGAAIAAGVAVAIVCYRLLDLRAAAAFAGVLGAVAVGGTWWYLAARRQLELLREGIAQERLARGDTAASAAEREAQWQMLVDALPQMVLYVDRDYRCQLHNRALAQWVGHPAADIRSRPLNDVVGVEIARDIRRRGEALAGREVHYRATWRQGAATGDYAVTLLAGRDANGQLAGFYVVAAKALPEDPAHPESVAGPSGASEMEDTTFLDTVSAHLMGPQPKQHLLRALENNDFLLFAQEVRPLNTDAPYPRCYEVLLRLREEEESMVPPGSFLPVAERYGLMVEIDRWVIRTLSQWCLRQRARDARWRMPLYCVNIASASLCDAGFARGVRRELLAQNFPGSQLCFEIAEADLVHHHAMVRKFTEELGPLGCRFALDGFGSTRTRYVRLKGLPLFFLKLDGSIIQNMLTDSGSLDRVRAIATASRRIGIRTIALHVESEAAVTRLRELGVDYVQGFGIGRPGPIADLS